MIRLENERSCLELFQMAGLEEEEGWDEYWKKVLEIGRIEENESFKEFFFLDRLGERFQYYRKEEEEFDFRQ